jgi:MFS family permease
MLTSIHPLGERARHNRWGLTVAAFVVAAIGTGAVLGAVLGWMGSLLPGGTWRWPVAAGAVAGAGIADLLRVRPPGPRRQVNEDWIGTYRGWVYGGGFGAQLGAGFVTYVVTWGVWAVLALMILVGDPLGGALIGVAFGLGRSVFPLAAGRIDRPSRLTEFSRRMAELAGPVARVTGTGLVLMAGAFALRMVLA